MSRSIHTTKKDLHRERQFAANDGVPCGPGATEIEREDIQKSLYKLNEQRRRNASKQKAPGHAILKLTKGSIVRNVHGNRTNTNRP